MVTVVEIAILLIVIAAVGLPIFGGGWSLAGVGSAAGRSDETEKLHELEFKKEAVVSALKDLEFDYKTGKISETDYHQMRESYQVRAVDLLKQIESAKQGITRSYAAAAVAEADETAGQVFCTECGTKNDAQNKFCFSCGAKLKRG